MLEARAGSIFASLVRTDEVHAVAAPRIKAALKSPAVLQRGESPVPENYENQRRDHGNKIQDRPALGTFVAIFARLPAHGMTSRRYIDTAAPIIDSQSLVDRSSGEHTLAENMRPF
jgi:hypothetical protein